MRIYLVRHPEVDAQGICYGRQDIPCKDGWQEALLTLTNKLPLNLSVVSSPSLRCTQLADKISSEFTKSDLLREMDFGHWEGRLWDDIPREEIDTWAKDPKGYVIPGGESYTGLRDRVHQFVDLQPKDRDLILVTHKGVIRAALELYSALDFEDVMKAELPFLGITEIHVG